MRQLADLLNSFAGSAARLQSSLPTPPTAGMPPGAVGGGAVVPPPPLSPHAAAAHPALAAAEAALMAKLAGGASGCNAEYAALLRLNDRLGLQGRFVAAATHPELNRYCDVLPFDSNRVRLGQQPGSQPAVTHGSSGVPAGPLASRAGSGSAGATAGAAAGTAAAASDYINASPLQRRSEEDIEWRYIAAQGPLRDTREAFWQMVVEGGASAVVMLTNLVERGVHKCSRYFPEAPRTSKYLGRYLVSTRSLEQLSPVLIRRSVSVKDAGPLLAARRHAQQAQQAQPAAAPSFTVQHFHYSAWPDHGVPTSPEPLLALCAELRRRGAHASPIVVHCSAGIGRSGVFCVLDVITRRLLGLQGCQDAARGAAAVDVAALVADLRHQRLGMVQTREQYQFCHMALLHFIRRLLEQPAPAAPAGGGKAASHTALVIPVRTS
ncbi:hypothetical protein D9Q98_006799 [Chlorella vulgaris]|uniref:Uncharacterized protein n=1 Tax=Chlorella vulgaris TaxID=3077 RepID=A0A9D4TIW6_CHLVU|nr:hypothetical protein D9Q98_006799 [Chlorella vulgaris]